MQSIGTQIEDYDYQLPPELIAQEPVYPRDSSRLLVVHRKEGRWEHRSFRDLPNYLDEDDLMIANNSRVLKARLKGWRLQEAGGAEKKKGGKVEFFLLEELRPRVWEGLFHASARATAGLKFEIPTPDGLSLFGTLIQGSKDSSSGTVIAEFDRDPVQVGAGSVPLPPYIKKESEEADYQTLYAKTLGSSAAPTAGLHFTPAVFDALKAKGVSWDEVTLHVGLGTFRPVKSLDIRDHSMHQERYEVSPEVARKVTDWKNSRKRVLAVGTTSVRTLESAWQNHLPANPSGKDGINSGYPLGTLKSEIAKTSIFIYPGSPQPFQVVDRLLTNFHLPRSTLLMLVSAFAGRDLILEAYQEAIRVKYRFFSFGDAMLIL